MTRFKLASAVRTTALLLTLLPFSSWAQVITEIHDPLRGVTYYSIEIGTHPLSELQVGAGQFADTDKMTLGVSAFAFDESEKPDDYVVWLRHEGPRRWFAEDGSKPLRLQMDSSVAQPSPLHTLSPHDGPVPGSFIEKLEFSLSPEQTAEILQSESLTVELSTLLGMIRMQLTEDELQQFRQFNERIILAQSEGANS